MTALIFITLAGAAAALVCSVCAYQRGRLDGFRAALNAQRNPDKYI